MQYWDEAQKITIDQEITSNGLQDSATQGQNLEECESALPWLLDMQVLSWNPLSVGFSSSLCSYIHCICLYLFMFWWVSFSLGHGHWIATQHPKPLQKKCQELQVSPGHGAVLLRDRMLSGHCRPAGKHHLQHAAGVSVEDLQCAKVTR